MLGGFELRVQGFVWDISECSAGIMDMRLGFTVLV